jgi:hypothetical protein
VTDLESQLRDCLSRHADDALPRNEMLRGARDRSRQLGRHRQSAAVVAMIPVTAGVVGGAVALAGGSAQPQAVHVRTLASISASPSPTMAAHPGPKWLSLHHCKAGEEPSLHINPGERSESGRQLRSLSDVIRSSSHLHGARAYGIVGTGGFVLNGHRPGRNVMAYEVLTSRERTWMVAISHPKQGWATYHATFIGCAPAPSD